MYCPSFTLAFDTVTCCRTDWDQQFNEDTMGCFQKVFFNYLMQVLTVLKLLMTLNFKNLNLPPYSPDLVQQFFTRLGL